MEQKRNSNGKIFNDPVYGFIKFPEPQLLQVIDHHKFQRLRHITQMGLSSLVYPGAVHTRFHHSLGACHLMQRALEELSAKGISITREEKLAARLAILMHDIGHGPFSHSLEFQLIEEVSHEAISAEIMKQLVQELSLPEETLHIFQATTNKNFLKQLVSSQLDVDRMDYLNRDSFYSGVYEGVIGYDRILQMLTVVDGQLAVEEKAIHSVEKFLIARRLMFWQVYLHKTVLGAELLLINIIRRAKECISRGERIFTTPTLSYFLSKSWNAQDFFSDKQHLDMFCELDDAQIMVCIKEWQQDKDPILSLLSQMLIKRKLYKVKIGDQHETLLAEKKEKLQRQFKFSEEDLTWFAFEGTTSNRTYDHINDRILIEMKDGRVANIGEVTDGLLNSDIGLPVEKKFVCYAQFE